MHPPLAEYRSLSLVGLRLNSKKENHLGSLSKVIIPVGSLQTSDLSSQKLTRLGIIAHRTAARDVALREPTSAQCAANPKAPWGTREWETAYPSLRMI